MDKAKLATVFALIGILVLLMVGYFMISKGNPTMIGGFITLATYLVKKLADQIDEIMDKLWDIQHKPEEEAK